MTGKLMLRPALSAQRQSSTGKVKFEQHGVPHGTNFTATVSCKEQTAGIAKCTVE